MSSDSKEEIIKTSGLLSYPVIIGQNSLRNLPSLEETIQFVKNKILETACFNKSIGDKIDIVHVTSDKIDWIQGKNRLELPVIKENLIKSYKNDPSIITLIEDKELLEQWFNYN